MFEDQQAWDNGFLTRIEHEVVGEMTVVAPPVKFSDSPLTALATAPLGKHTREVLAEAGVAADEIEGPSGLLPRQAGELGLAAGPGPASAPPNTAEIHLRQGR